LSSPQIRTSIKPAFEVRLSSHELATKLVDIQMAVVIAPAAQSMKEMETLIWGSEEEVMCQSVIAQSKWSKLVKQATLVKCSNMVKDWSNERGLTTNIDIFGCLCKF